MDLLTPLHVALALGATGQSFATQYTPERTLRVESRVVMALETTSFRMERDGEPVEGRGDRGGGVREERHVVEVDRVLEAEGDAPARVRRSFELAEAEATSSFGGEDRAREVDCPLSGVTIEVDADGDAEVVEGDAPADDALAGHRPELALDALLPAGEVEEGATWSLEGPRVARALGLDRELALYPEPDDEDDGEGGGRGRFGRGGGGRSIGRMLHAAEWSGTATLVSLAEDHEGISCALVTFEAEASGDLPEPELGGRRSGRGGDAPSLETAGGRLASTYRVTLEGRLWFSLEKARPVALEVEGKLHTERSIERDSERGSFVVEIVQDGTYERSVSVEEPAADDETRDE